MRTLIALVAVLVGSGCTGLDGLVRGMGMGGVSPPAVTLREAALVTAPSEKDLAAYYCPRVLAQQVGFAAGSSLVCGQFFGQAPAPAQMQIGFDLRFSVANPNQIPLPL